MLKPLPIRRAGMTLVELLVVVAIIGLLAVTVLPNVASTTENRRSREAARVTSSFFAKAQSRAIGRPEWAGVTVVPTNAKVLYAIDLFQANVPQVYRGESLESKAFIAGSDPDYRDLAFYEDRTTKQIVPIPGARNIATGDLIRLDGTGPWYEFMNTTPYALRLRGTLGGSAAAQSPQNTPWPAQAMSPAAPPDVAHTFEILRQPVRNGSAFTIPDGRCIDLAWSGFGSPATFLSSRFTIAGTAVTLLFDATGRVRQIFRQNADATDRVTVTGPVYFLVGRVDRANNNPTLPSTYDGTDDTKGFNWQYGDSYWIVIDPASGIVKTSECMPVKTYTDLATGLILSQQFARSETPTGGK